jgi:hypothetical protein
MADIKVYGTLHAQTGDGIVARAAQIKDTNLNKTQQELNAAFNEAIQQGAKVEVEGDTIVFS